MASDMGGFIFSRRYTTAKISGFPSSPDNSATADTRHLPGGTQDPYFGNVQLLLHGDGADPLGNGTNSGKALVDSSQFNRAITNVGDVQTSSIKSEFGGTSLRFDGTGDYLRVGSATDWKFLHDGTSYTVEGFVSVSDFASSRVIFDTAQGTTANIGAFLYVTTSGLLNFSIVRGVGGTNIVSGTSTTALTPGIFQHVAVTFDLGPATDNAVFYISGNRAGSSTKTGNAPSSSNPSATLAIGALTNGTSPYLGYMDEIRITSGVVRARSNFFPPTRAFPDF